MKRGIGLLLVICCLLSLLSVAGVPAAGESTSRAAGKKLIALTFDDGPGKDTKRLLDALRVRGAHCTFFIVGYCAAARPSVVKQCYEDGHQIANHTYDHPYLTKLSDSQIRSQLSRTAAVLDSAIGASNTYMVRPPYGSFNQHVLSVLGVPAFFWSDDSGDWRPGATADSVYQKTIASAEDGDILLLHDSHSWSVDAAIRIVDTLQAQGYEFVTLSELFRRRGVPLEAGKIYYWLRDNGTNLPGISSPKLKCKGQFDGSTVLVMESDPGTQIRYTTDGTTPNAASPVYTAPIPVTNGMQITAVAGYDMNGSRSDPAGQTVRQLPRAASPTIDISEDGLCTIRSDAAVYYTTDGSVPTANSPVYQSAFSVSPDTVVRAVAYPADGSAGGSLPASLCLTGRGNVFSDVFPSDWYYDAVDEACANGILNGVGGYRIQPNRSLTRGMLVTVLYRMAGSPEIEFEQLFDDVESGRYYSDPVVWAAGESLITGFPDGSFRPDAVLTREQLAVILYRAAGSPDAFQEILDQFADVENVSYYALDALSWAVNVDLINGTGNGLLKPGAATTRAQLAAICQRLDRLNQR